MKFLGKELGKNQQPFIVAEISCSHEGDVDQGTILIDAAKAAGADAVKIQIYTPDDMTLNSAEQDFYINNGQWKGRFLYDLYTKTQTDFELAKSLFSHAKSIDFPIFASVFSRQSAQWADDFGSPAFKIASFELTDTQLIKYAASKNKPMILSTGMANLDEIEIVTQYTNPDNTILLHCVSAYPTPLEETNLWRIAYLKNMFKCPVGFSDHTEGHLAAQIACGMGAVMIEKHLYLGGGGSEDATFSLTPQAFKFFVKACRRAAETSFYAHSIAEEQSRQFRRSIYAVADIKKGEALTANNIRVIRPGYGLPAYNYVDAIGKLSLREIKAGEALKEKDLAWVS